VGVDRQLDLDLDGRLVGVAADNGSGVRFEWMSTAVGASVSVGVLRPVVGVTVGSTV
jgi:hypothetical protein